VSNELVALLLGGALVATAGAALFSKNVSSSLIALFYSSLVLGIAFTFYGDALLGLLTMVTFAGAVSVLLLTVILMTGEPKLDIGARRLGLSLIPFTVVVGLASFVAISPGGGGGVVAADNSMEVFGFVWTLRPWDLLILIVVFASAMVAVASMFGGED
jgi:NADH:ubiquinone oxidoreductase subunit 6 (subunit J)